MLRSHLLPLNSSCASWNDSKLCNLLPPGYTNGLLLKAVDLADRLMPAFDTPSGIPLSWVNLRKVGGRTFTLSCLMHALSLYITNYRISMAWDLDYVRKSCQCTYIYSVWENVNLSMKSSAFLILSKHQSQACFHRHFLLPGGVSRCAIQRAIPAVKILTVVILDSSRI